jgi:XrtN system VIT domain protein
MIALSRSGADNVKKDGVDHIMRLFAYNHIMRGLKGNLFPESYNDSGFVAEAEQAYVVTPVSSLVVLESQKDYDRFGIKRSGNTLDNATLASNGAVPEPHEWALILLAVAVLIYAYYGKRTAKVQ